MKVKKTDIEDVYVITPDVYEDHRGHFFESFNTAEFKASTGIDFKPFQVNISKSNKRVLRGMHYQNPPYEQAKIVSVIQGRVQDVIVDMRAWSKTYKEHFSIELSSENKKQLFVPKGFAHGFLSHSHGS